MGLSPQEMETAIIKNLASKTGRELEGWFEVLKQTNTIEKKEMKTYLKSEHGVGHFQAQTIVKRYLTASETST